MSAGSHRPALSAKVVLRLPAHSGIYTEHRTKVVSRGSVPKNTCFNTFQMTSIPSGQLVETIWYSLIKPMAKKCGILTDFVVGCGQNMLKLSLDVMV